MVAAAALALGVSACNSFAPCGRSSWVEVTSVFDLMPVSGFTTSSPPATLELGTEQIWDVNIERRPGVFDALWESLIEGSTLPAGQGLAITLTGRAPGNTQSLSRAVLILPTPLVRGRQYQITRAFPVPIGMQNPDVFGTRYLGREPLAQSGAGEIAFFYGRREFVQGDPLAHEFAEFIATAASGSVNVSSDAGNELRVQIDVNLTDATGRTLRMAGELRARGQVENNACIS
jgi:hypothetical protein